MSAQDDCTLNLALFQKPFMKKMDEIKQFTKLAKRKFKEFEMDLLNIFGKSNLLYNENSPLLLEFLKNRISSLEKEVIEKDGNIFFSSEAEK